MFWHHQVYQPSPYSNHAFKYICVLLLSTFILNVKIQAQATGAFPASWKKQSPKGCGCVIAMPGELRNGEKKLLTEIGTVQPVTWISQGEDDDPNYLYMVSWVDYPENTLPSDSVEFIRAFFEETLNAHSAQLRGKIVYSVDKPLFNLPSQLFRISYNNNDAVVKGRMLLKGNRFYMWQVFTLSSKSLNKEMDLFLDSFSFLKE